MGMGFNGFDSFMFSVVPIILVFGFIFVFGIIIFRIIKGSIQWNKNNNAPGLTVDAKIVTKRTSVNRYNHTGSNDTMHHSSTSTTYFVTFEVSSGDRMEFHVPDSEFGMLVEGDVGKLTFQGTRFKEFQRLKK